MRVTDVDRVATAGDLTMGDMLLFGTSTMGENERRDSRLLPVRTKRFCALSGGSGAVVVEFFDCCLLGVERCVNRRAPVAWALRTAAPPAAAACLGLRGTVVATATTLRERANIVV